MAVLSSGGWLVVGVPFHHQAFDPAMHLRPRIDQAQGVYSNFVQNLKTNSERDLVVAFLLGRTLSMPVSYATDSPIFLDVFRRCIRGYRAQEGVIQSYFKTSGVSWNPFGVVLFEGFDCIQDIASKYRWAPARFAMFRGMPYDLQSTRVQELSNCLGKGDARAAAALGQSYANRDDLEEAYGLLLSHFKGPDAIIRPKVSRKLNYASTISSFVTKLREDGETGRADRLDGMVRDLHARLRGDAKVPGLNIGAEAVAEAYRGAWYAYSEVFEDEWDRVAASLDSIQSGAMIDLSGAVFASYVAPVVPIDAEPGEPKPVISGLGPSEVDWASFWKSFAQKDVLKQVVAIARLLKVEQAPTARRYAIESHIGSLLGKLDGVKLRIGNIKGDTVKEALEKETKKILEDANFAIDIFAAVGPPGSKLTGVLLKRAKTLRAMARRKAWRNLRLELDPGRLDECEDRHTLSQAEDVAELNKRAEDIAPGEIVTLRAEWGDQTVHLS